MGKISFIGMLLGLFFLGLSNVFATTIHVPADQPTIQAGINAAVNGDTVLVAPGTYTVNITLLGKGILLTSSGGSNATILEPLDIWTPIVRCVTAEDTTTVIEGFTIRNASKSHGIRCVDSSPIIKHCEVAFCTTPGGTDGAGIWCCRTVDLGRITCPLVLVAGAKDHITPAPQVLAAQSAMGSQDVLVVETPGGHIGSFMGRRELAECWPGILEWLRARDGATGLRPMA